MITHMLLAKWKPTTSGADVQRLLEMIGALLVPIPQILSFQAGEDFSKYSAGFTHVVVLTFADRDALQHYLRHPAHRPVVDLWNQLQEQWIGIDLEG